MSANDPETPWPSDRPRNSLVFWARFAPCFVDRILGENRLRFQKKHLQSFNFKIIKFFKTEVISSDLEFTQFAGIPRGYRRSVSPHGKIDADIASLQGDADNRPRRRFSRFRRVARLPIAKHLHPHSRFASGRPRMEMR